jgi:alkanesulfonate monooxygenase SsuD/methylene tetrahydromethanopterin reductase-like flavin-dependent oxidoreductase (luciferase family)
MRQPQRHMHLAAFLIAGPVALSHAPWRHPAHDVPFLSVDYYVEMARVLERGRFDLLFFVDRLAIADGYGGNKTVGLRYGDQDATRLDSLPILGALAERVRGIPGSGARDGRR